VRIYRREKNAASGNFSGLFQEKPWFSRLFDDYRELEASELPLDVRSGCEYRTICINTSIYLPWLVGQCRRAGVVFKRAALSHIREARTLHHSHATANIIINASGLLASKLGGVEDKTVYPVRGQIVVVRNEVSPMMVLSGTNVCYMMQRPAGGGTILGGTYERDNWDPNPNPNTAIDIMKRCVELNPSLTNGEGIEALSIVRHGVGLRPARENGVRIEKDTSVFDDCPVVHNYGHAGWGYQGSYGCAERVVELVEEVKQGSIRAKL
jgi:D-amino-acid oxidase